MGDEKSLKQAEETFDINDLPEGAYNAVVEQATLQEIRLIGSQFSISPSYFSEDEEGEERELFNQQKAASISYSSDDGFIVASFEFSVRAEREGDELLLCEAQYIVFFTVEEEVDEQAARVFAFRTGRSAAYPYFREFVASQSWAAGAELPILPILRSHPRRSKSGKT